VKHETFGQLTNTPVHGMSAGTTLCGIPLNPDVRTIRTADPFVVYAETPGEIVRSYKVTEHIGAVTCARCARILKEM
jgi:hypothetical protein